MKDFLAPEGTVVEPATPRAVVKEAFAVSMITDGQVWLDMIEMRNLLSHTYDQAVFDRAVTEIDTRFFGAIHALTAWFEERASP